MSTLSSAELICVNPALVDQFWPYAKDLIQAAIDRTNLSRFEDVERDVLEGHALLWLAWSGKIEAAAVTQLVDNVCIIVACSGEDRERWLSLFGLIENYAKAEGCKSTRIYGRKGWERVLTGYTAKYVILERQL